MPKNKFQEVIFTIIMVFVMVYAMICYNIVLNTGTMTNGYFLSLSIPSLIITANFLLSLFLVRKTSDKTLLLHQL